MIDNPHYSPEVQGHYELADIGDLRLEEGGTLRGCRLGYTTFGTLDADKSNAILVPTWYSGTHQIMGQVYIGKDHALNPERYFIIVVNQIGSGISSSPHNTVSGPAVCETAVTPQAASPRISARVLKRGPSTCP